MTNPLYPSLVPRYVDKSWFSADQPVDECAKLNELEAHKEHVWYQHRGDAQPAEADPESREVEEEEDDDDDEDEDYNDDEVDEDDEDYQAEDE